MYSVLSKVEAYVKPRPKGIVPKPTSLTGKLHYRVTFVILMVACLLVSTYQFIDSTNSPIQCLMDKGTRIEKDVINRYCWVMSTFTLPRKFKGIQGEDFAYQGVGDDGKDEEKEYHAYYQWVPIVLALQALMFYAPHFIWKVYEGGRMKRTVNGLSPDVKDYNGIGQKLESLRDALKKLLENDDVENLQEQIDVLKENIKDLSTQQSAKADQFSSFLFSHSTHKIDEFTWTYFNYFYEALNLLHVIVQIFVTNKFLDGEFLKYGTDALRHPFVDPEDRVDPMSRVFPKMTKCWFYKYGSSGTLEKFDSVCVLSMNILNEKIYVFLWFWFIILSVLTAVGLAWKIYRHYSPDYNACEDKLKKLSYKIDRKMRIQVNGLQRKMSVPSLLIFMTLAESVKPESGFQVILRSLAEKFNIEASSMEDIMSKSDSENKENIPLRKITTTL